MKNEQISQFLQSRIDAKDFPSAVYLVAEKGEIVFEDALGFAVVEPQKIEARIETVYDLASLTKPLVTGLLCAKLIERGELNLNDKVCKYSEFFAAKEKSEVTIENLLTHTSGFAAWRPFYLMAEKFSSGSDVLNIISEFSSENPVNSTVVYSDLNFIALGFILEKIYGKTLDEIAADEIFAPLDLRTTLYNPPPSMKDVIAANEKGNEFEKQLCVELNFKAADSRFRQRILWGEVDDGNCYFMNGVAGHAGLFSTARETFKIAQQFLAEETILLKPQTCELFRTNLTRGLNEARSAAFRLAETKDSAAGGVLAKNSFGHLGFTGTSLWIEPETRRIYILLTNRTHEKRLPFVNINPTRRRFHELAAQMLAGRRR